MRNFLLKQTGAVTTDWFVLTFAVVGITAAVLSLIGTGSLELAPGAIKHLPPVEMGG